MYINLQVAIIATVFVVVVLLSYVWAYWHYYYVSKDKLHNILYSITGGKWPPVESSSVLNVSLYKTVITMLISIMLDSNRNKNLAHQLVLSILLLITQIAELHTNKRLKQTSLIYHTCANSILLLLVPFTAIGIFVSLFQATSSSPTLDKLNYWYWKSLVTVWIVLYTVMFK